MGDVGVLCATRWFGGAGTKKLPLRTDRIKCDPWGHAMNLPQVSKATEPPFPIKISALSGRLPCGSDNKESVCNAGDPGSVSGSGRSPGEGNGNPLQYSCLENSMDRGDWWATVHGVTESDTTERLTLSLPANHQRSF